MADQTTKKHPVVRFILIFVVSILLLAGGLFVYGAKFLSLPASPPRKSDLIAVLGGNTGSREPKALELVKGGKLEVKSSNQKDQKDQKDQIDQVDQKDQIGYAPRVLFIGLKEPPEAFSSSGISKDNIYYDSRSTNSWDEAVNTFALMKEKGLKSVIVVSDPPHMLRLRYAWGKVFRKSGLKFTLVAASPRWWDAGKWWSNKKTRKFVISEYLKLAFFIYQYHFCRLQIADSRWGKPNKLEKPDLQSPISDLPATSTAQRSCFQADENTKKKWEDRIDKWFGDKKVKVESSKVQRQK